LYDIVYIANESEVTETDAQKNRAKKEKQFVSLASRDVITHTRFIILKKRVKHR